MLLTAAVIIAVLVSVVFFYNQLAKLEVLTLKAWNDVTQQFDRQHTLLQQLNEQSPIILPAELEKLLQKASDTQNTTERLQTEKQLENMLEQFLNQSDIQNKDELKQEADKIETDLQKARRKYNASVKYYNVALHTVPTCWIAKATKAEEKTFYKND